MSKLWIPGIDGANDVVEVTTPERRVLPIERKAEGGSWFDDEMETETEHHKRFQDELNRLMKHLNVRPDHVVYVGSTKDREDLRRFFNHAFSQRAIGHHPNIRIDYGVPDGTIRVGE